MTAGDIMNGEYGSEHNCGALNGRLCVITGASNGIGRAIAQRFAQEGAKLILVSRSWNDFNGLDELAPDAIFIEADVSKVSNLDSIVEAIKHSGLPLHAVVPVVGGGPGSSIRNTTEEEFDTICNLNMRSSFFTVQKTLPFMIPGSAIVLFASIAGFQGGKGAIVYNATKAAVRSFVRSMAAELGQDGIRANAISPGPTQTRGFDEFIHDSDEIRHHIETMIPLGRIGDPEEVASVALFLATSASSYINGEHIVVDGGFTNS